VACIGKNRNAYRDLVEKYEGRKLFGKSQRLWDGNVKMDHKEIR
jgi:hypothetical protein